MKAAVWIFAGAALATAIGCSSTTRWGPPAPGVPQANVGARCNPTFYRPVGAPKPSPIPLQGPGIVIGGGGLDVNGEFVWIHDTVRRIARSQGRRSRRPARHGHERLRSLYL